MGVVGGAILAAPAADATAAEFGVNLVVNPGFESVNAAVTAGNGSVQILSWSAGTHVPFAYNHGQGYANGGPLAGGGTYYFTPNASLTTNITAPEQVTQIVDLSAGAAAVAIAQGTARYTLSAYMSGYLTQGDFGNVHVAFRAANDATLGNALISDEDTSHWGPLQIASGAIPVGTASARVSLYGTALVGGPDGFIDNVSFVVTQQSPPAPEVPGLTSWARWLLGALLGVGLFARLRRTLA